MAGFQDIELWWKDENFTVPANKVWLMLAQIEQALVGNTGRDPGEYLVSSPSKLSISRAYATALRYAGADVRDEDVYLSISQALTDGDMDGMANTITAATWGLLEMFHPGTVSWQGSGDIKELAGSAKVAKKKPMKQARKPRTRTPAKRKK